MSRLPGRGCALRGEAEEAHLTAGLDFRQPRYRREVFLRFYEFHLRWRAHPGCVYYLLPWLSRERDAEERLWLAFVNGNTQNPVTSWLITRAFPRLAGLDLAALDTWFRANYARLAFDTDRRYHKKSFVAAVANYQRWLGGRAQADAFGELTQSTADTNFRLAWQVVLSCFTGFGRLSAFSYLEYLRILGIPLECDNLFLEDMSGSKSHRNGLAKVLGRDDLDWHESNPGFDGHYPPALLAWLREEGARLLAEARARLDGAPFAGDVGYFTLESALCTYKSWHRPNRRYPNVYNDMLVDRIRAGERAWGERFETFWEARRAALPRALRLEDNPADPGVHPDKQNHYRLTGEVVMMDRDWPCFRNAFNDRVRRAQGETP